MKSLGVGCKPRSGGADVQLARQIKEDGYTLTAVPDQGVNAPVIMDGNHLYARLWIRYVHEREHASTEKTIAQLREGFYVLRMKTNHPDGGTSLPSLQDG